MGRRCWSWKLSPGPAWLLVAGVRLPHQPGITAGGHTNEFLLLLKPGGGVGGEDGPGWNGTWVELGRWAGLKMLGIRWAGF